MALRSSLLLAALSLPAQAAQLAATPVPSAVKALPARAPTGLRLTLPAPALGAPALTLEGALPAGDAQRFTLLEQGAVLPELALTTRLEARPSGPEGELGGSALEDLGPLQLIATATLFPAGRSAASLTAAWAFAPGWSLAAGPAAAFEGSVASRGWVATARWSPLPELVVAASARTRQGGEVEGYATLGWTPGTTGADAVVRGTVAYLAGR